MHAILVKAATSTVIHSFRGNPVGSRSITMPHYLWNINAVGWPVERIDTLSG